jgi:hypothetical protein
MGFIISSRRNEDKVILEVQSEYSEFLELKGHFDDVHIFTDKVAYTKTNISQRGKNDATKYFLIPKNLRQGFQFNNDVSCQRIDLKNKVVFVYVVDKFSVAPSRRELALKEIEKRRDAVMNDRGVFFG